MGYTDLVSGFASFNWSGIWSGAKKVLFNMIKIPFEFFRNLPEWVKISIFVFLVMVSLVLILWYIRNKKAWMYVRY